MQSTAVKYFPKGTYIYFQILVTRKASLFWEKDPKKDVKI